jgi:hypothetical protein
MVHDETPQHFAASGEGAREDIDNSQKEKAEAAAQCMTEKENAVAAAQRKAEKEKAEAAAQCMTEKENAVAAAQRKAEKEKAEAAAHFEAGD